MKLVNKHLIGEILKNKVFLILMLLLASFTSFMFFFVHFSIDENMVWLNKMAVLNEEQILFENGLISNTILVHYIFIAFTAFTGFVFGMFYYRFFQSAKKQFGCLKSLGFKDKDFMLVLQKVSGCISMFGAVIGLGAGYAASDVLILSNKQSYLVSGIVKGISPGTLIIGLLVPGTVFCLITCFMYHMIRGKEAGELLAGMNCKADGSTAFFLADKVSGWFPQKNRLSVRLALRNPVAVLLIIASVLVLSTMFLLAYSLNISSGKVFETQTLGHYYLYQTYYDEPQNMVRESQRNENKSVQNGADFYLTAEGILEGKSALLEWTIAGGNGNKKIYELFNADGDTIEFPKYGELVISSQLEELYGIKLGDKIMVRTKGQEHLMIVSGIAYNAKQGWAYVSKKELCEMLSLTENSYNEIFSMGDFYEG